MKILTLHLIDLLRQQNYDVLSIKEKHRGMIDIDVVEVVKSYQGVLITEDKDFGELVFAYHIKGFSVIFLRYDKEDFENIVERLLVILDKYYSRSGYYFITVTKNKTRVTNI